MKYINNMEQTFIGYIPKREISVELYYNSIEEAKKRNPYIRNIRLKQI